MLGDLGVQKGVLRWFLSLHSDYNIGVSPHKEEPKSKKKAKKAAKKNDEGSDTEDDEMPQVPGQETSEAPGDASAVPPVPKQEAKDREENLLPPTLTPSVNKILHPSASESSFKPPALPAGLTVASLKSRMNSKNKVK
jgi:DNA-3-methyladenine glycosylase II